MTKHKTKRKSHLWLWVMCLLACSFMWTPKVMADQVETDGDWAEGKRGFIQDCPVTVTYDEAFLYIETTSTRSDITIRIVKDGNILYEETLYSPQTATTIALDFLEPGTYRLELTNQWGDYLFGTFEK